MLSIQALISFIGVKGGIYLQNLMYMGTVPPTGTKVKIAIKPVYVFPYFQFSYKKQFLFTSHS